MDKVDLYIKALNENHKRAQDKNKQRYEELLNQANKSKNNEPINIYPKTNGI